MKESNGTPLPWRVVNRGSSDAWDIEGPNVQDMSGMLRGMLYHQADAEFIVLAANHYEELLAACKFLCAEILNRSSQEHLERCVAEIEVVLEEAESEEGRG